MYNRLKYNPSSRRNSKQMTQGEQCLWMVWLVTALDPFGLHRSTLDYSSTVVETAVSTTSTAHTCTYTVARYCSIAELAPLLDEDEDMYHIRPNLTELET